MYVPGSMLPCPSRFSDVGSKDYSEALAGNSHCGRALLVFSRTRCTWEGVPCRNGNERGVEHLRLESIRTSLDVIHRSPMLLSVMVSIVLTI